MPSEKNEFVISVSDKLKKSRYDFKPENRKTFDDIIRELDYGSKGDVWKDFEVRFQEVHAGFYKRLNEKFPDLSPNELKLCAFLHLNMSTKEISTITFQSTKSINMARFRLQKKMDIVNYESLVAFLSQLLKSYFFQFTNSYTKKSHPLLIKDGSSMSINLNT